MPDPLDLSRYAHVIWDWNGTLLNDVDVARDAVNGMLRRRGLSRVNREQYQATFDFPIEDYYQRLGFDFEIEPFSDLAAEFHQAYQRVWRTCGLRPGADRSLRLAAEGGVQQSLLSASEQTALEQHVAHYRLRDHFSRLVGIDDRHAVGKLEQGIALVGDLGHVPQRVLMIGDTVHDYEVAQAAGVDCALIADGHQSADRLAECGVPVYDALLDVFGFAPL